MKDLLFILADYPFKETNRQILSDLLGKVEDWDKLVRLVNDHGIIALARYNIREAGLDTLVPGDALAKLENGYLQNTVRNTWLAERWKEVNEILNKNNINHILLKGMALEHTVYESKGLRQMSDTDILIKMDESMRAWHLLQENGFEPELLKSPLYKKIIKYVGKHLPTLTKDGYSVEIHTRLFDDYSIDEKSYDKLFESTPEILIKDTRAFILPDDIHLKYLISHFSHHLATGFCQIGMLTDIKLLDPKAAMEFPSVFIENPIRNLTFSGRKAYYRSRVMVVPPRYRFRYIIGDLFPSIEWMKVRHRCGAVKALLYYPRRIGKLFWLL